MTGDVKKHTVCSLRRTNSFIYLGSKITAEAQKVSEQGCSTKESGMQSLAGTIAVITGGSRNGGRGIALALGSAGATVYVTGRSVRGASTTSDPTATIEDTAELVTARGGTCIPVQVDHTNDAQ